MSTTAIELTPLTETAAGRRTFDEQMIVRFNRLFQPIAKVVR